MTRGKKEKEVANELSSKLKEHGEKSNKEFVCEHGKIDILTNEKIIEIKGVREWKHGLGQLIAYDDAIPGRKLILYLFVKGNERVTNNLIDNATRICKKHNISVELHHDVQIIPGNRCNWFKKLTKDQYGDLKVLGYDYDRKNGYWLCKCSCGRIESIARRSLESEKKLKCTKCKNNYKSIPVVINNTKYGSISEACQGEGISFTTVKNMIKSGETKTKNKSYNGDFIGQKCGDWICVENPIKVRKNLSKPAKHESDQFRMMIKLKCGGCGEEKLVYFYDFKNNKTRACRSCSAKNIWRSRKS